jgi:hypothetical protein
LGGERDYGTSGASEEVGGTTTDTEQFIERKKVQSPHSRTLRMLEVAVRYIKGQCAEGKYGLNFGAAYRASAELDRIASEPPNEPKLP